jgi:hypothetical protein
MTKTAASGSLGNYPPGNAAVRQICIATTSRPWLFQTMGPIFTKSPCISIVVFAKSGDANAVARLHPRFMKIAFKKENRIWKACFFLDAAFGHLAIKIYLLLLQYS